MEASYHWRCRIIFLFIFTWTNFLVSAREICGLLDVTQPAINGRNVTMSFTPTTQLQHGRAVWARSRTGSAWIDLPPSAKFVQYTTEQSHFLTITNSNKDVDGILYKIKYHNETGVYCTTTVKLDIAAITGCGLLHLRTSRIVQNGTVELGYFPTSYILNYPRSYDRQWLRSSDDCPNGCRVNPSETVEEILYPNYEYVLVLHNFQSKLSGDFRVQCTTDRRKNKVTELVHVALPVPPSMPALGPLETFGNCKSCIVGKEEEIVKVTCNVSEGTENNVTIRTGDNYLPAEQDVNNEEFVTFIKLNNTLHHMANVTCSVENHATTKPLSVTAVLFVSLLPHAPPSLLIPSKLIEDQPVNITCLVSDVRPPPTNITMYIDETALDGLEIKHELNEVTLLYNSWVTLTKFQRNWNKKNVTCCVYNEGFQTDDRKICSLPKTVDYAYRFVIEFNYSHSELSISHGSMFYIECSVKSNSVSRLVWYDVSVNDSLVECNGSEADINGTSDESIAYYNDTTTCILAIDTRFIKIGITRFTCRADNTLSYVEKSLIVNVYDPGTDTFHYGHVVVVVASVIIFCVIITGLSLGIMCKRRKVKRSGNQHRIAQDATQDDGELADAYTALYFDSSGETTPYALMRLRQDSAADHEETKFGGSCVDEAIYE